MIKYCFMIALSALAVSVIAAPACRVLADRLGCVAQVRDRDMHIVPIPYLGGVAIYLGLWAAYAVASTLPQAAVGTLALDDVRHVLVACGIVFAGGLVDDILDLPALAKLGCQILAGAVLAWWQVRLFFLPLPGGVQLSLDDAQSSLLTIFLVVLGANAVNLIDGLDGLASGVVAAGGGGLLIYAVNGVEQSGGLGGSVVVLSAAIVGSCAGFYVHNFYPARMFMGDAGALLLGTLLVASAILSMQLGPAINPEAQGVALGSSSRVGFFLWIGLPIAIIGLPTLDLGIAIIRRLKNRQPLFAPDKKHLHHILVQSGRSHFSASILLTLWAAVISCGAAWIVIDPTVGHIIVVLISAVAVVCYSEISSRYVKKVDVI